MKNEKFSLEELYKIVDRRIKSKDVKSYSFKLYKNPKLLNKKILEEAKELTQAKNKKQVIWEAFDLLYFITVFIVKRMVKLSKVKKKLEERNKKARKLYKVLKEGDKK